MMDKTSIRIISLIVLTATLAVAVFGFSLMSGEPGHVMAGCFGSMPGASCSLLAPMEHFEAHLHTFQNISTGVVGALSLIAATFALLLVGYFSKNKTNDENSGERSALSARLDFITPHRVQFARWLALRERRDPSSFAYAMNA